MYNMLTLPLQTIYKLEYKKRVTFGSFNKYVTKKYAKILSKHIGIIITIYR